MSTTTTSVSDQLRDMWRTRPLRLPDKGPLAGVAAGIGYRYGVDPVIVRVALVVSTFFGGTGIVAYIAGWLFLPQVGDRASAAEGLFGKGQTSESHTKSVVLLVALIIAVSTLGPIGVGLGGAGLVSTVLLCAGLWLLHQRQPTPPPPPLAAGSWTPPGLGFPNVPFPANRPTPVGDAPAYGPYTTLPDHYEPDRPSPAPASDEPAHAGPSLVKDESAQQKPVAEQLATTPPAWDPLGVAPFAWDLPEPATATVVAPVATVVHRPRSRITPIVLGLALIAGAAAGGLAVAGVDWLTPGRIGAVALAVIGLGLVAGALLRRGYGLLIVAAPLAGYVVVASLVGSIDFDRATLGEREWRPTSAADLEPGYAVLLGTGTLDLRSLNLTDDTSVSIDAQLGEIKVILPENLDVDLDSIVFAGERTGLPDGFDAGNDGTKGPVLTLDVSTRLASVEVNRG